MEITNKTDRPIRVPLPAGKKLFLGPGKTARVNPKSAEHPPVIAMVESGDLEIVEGGRDSGGKSSGGPGGVRGDQGTVPTGNIRRTGDR